jgi:hypothetical protein
MLHCYYKLVLGNYLCPDLHAAEVLLAGPPAPLLLGFPAAWPRQLKLADGLLQLQQPPAPHRLLATHTVSRILLAK